MNTRFIRKISKGIGVRGDTRRYPLSQLKTCKQNPREIAITSKGTKDLHNWLQQ